MDSTTDTQRASGARPWLTVAVVVFLAVGAASLGVSGVIDSSERVGDDPSRSDVSASQATQQDGWNSGTTPLGDAETKFEGASANDTFGAALAHGDLNGDGVEDLIVGAPENDTASGNKSGAVYVFYGPVNETDVDAASADVTLTGVDDSDRAGYSVAAGDVNDDGTDDVVVGAPLNDRNGSSAGIAYVVHGGDLPESASLAEADRKLVGASAGDRAGWAVATVNRSQGDDVLVGAPQNSSAGQNAGAVYVVSDADGENVSLADAAATLEGESSGDFAGWSVAPAGDFDGDGDRDIVVGAMNNDSNAGEAGAAYVLTANVSGTQSLSEATVKLAGDAARDHAGWSVAEAGDVNNDSYGDVVVGAPYNDQHGTSAGAAYVVHGGEDVTGTVNLTDAGTTLLGDSEDDQAGYDVSSAGSGDVTCDEYADVLVGAPGNNSTAPDAGAVYLVEGSEEPATERNLSTATAKLVGESEGDRAGQAVSDAGDATDNGSTDVLVGAPRNDSGEVDTGAAYLIAGHCPEPKEKDDDRETTEQPDTTEAPTTEKPTTEEPTTEQPTTEKTTTEAPTTTADGAPPVTEEPTTEQPTTEEPTTEEPTTEQPTTEQPTTEQPTTEAPTTEAPTTEAPTTEQPTTQAPTTEAPTTEQPTTEQPTTEQPTTEAPTTEQPTTPAPAPTTEQPTTEQPTTEAPTTEQPTTEAPTTEEPTTEAPTTEAPTTTADGAPPVTEEPTTEQPTTEQPTTEQPTTEAPTTEQPTTEAPTTEQPTTEAPTTEQPTTEAPTTEQPTTEAPTTEQPTTTTAVPEIPPPKFAGCSQIIVYSDTSVSSFEIVLYDEEGDAYSTVTVDVDDADSEYDYDQQNFGSGEEGVVGYGFEQGDEFESGIKVVGVVDYQGADYVSPNFNLDTGNCGGAGGVVEGDSFDWSDTLDSNSGLSIVNTGAAAPGAALIASVGSLGLFVRTRN
ncbi:FG-GAP-like repeat-containing protein [Halobacterium sp. R2-5]|uniref:FG-GAP-like repeat-containing protein n=1 Tax=Halobacterium sp. R2-5 TaxID=2715751 RepID=UPI0014210B55|nr:FG-GAP-like repeat-containing protein [Halobacterium sp. R2-5]NIB98606.1 hypothetical protein [Halobacterium sp. R2-5]